jgi:PadR family transcriptional regulator PadR
MNPSQPSTEAVRGSIDLLALKAISLGAMHGWGISQRIEELSRGALELSQGSLYPALQRLEQRGWILGSWQTTENNRRARYYRLTASGRAALGTETASWRRYVGALELVLSHEVR